MNAAPEPQPADGRPWPADEPRRRRAEHFAVPPRPPARQPAKAPTDQGDQAAGVGAAEELFGDDLAPGRRDPGPDGCGLRFERPAGPLVVVCGLHGGAGTSTLACALAAQAACESPSPVLLCESAAAAGDVAGLTGASSRFSLAELAAELQAGRRAAPGSLARAGALRVIATAPAPAPAVEEGAVPSVLAAARSRLGLTVIDAGTVRAPDVRELLLAASHVIWVTAARPDAADRGRALLASALVPALPARQLLAVRGGRRGRAPLRGHGRELRRLADDHCDRLIFVADSPGIDPTGVDRSDRRLRGALTALAGFLTARERD